MPLFTSVSIGEGEVDFPALFRTLRETGFAQRHFKVADEPVITASLFDYPEEYPYRRHKFVK